MYDYLWRTIKTIIFRIKSPGYVENFANIMSWIGETKVCPYFILKE